MEQQDLIFSNVGRAIVDDLLSAPASPAAGVAGPPDGLRVPIVVEIAERGLILVAVGRPEIGAHLVASEVAHDRLSVIELLGDLFGGHRRHLGVSTGQ